MFWWQGRVGDPAAGSAQMAFTDARDGVSRGPTAGLNLGGGVGDLAEHVEENRRRLAEAVGVARDHLVLMDQVHGNDVAVVERAGQVLPPCDGVVTTRSDLALVVLVADCTPVLLADPEAGVVAAVHAGRPGMMSGIVGTAVDAMRDLGASRPVAMVGPSVCGRCYEVPAAMREDATRVTPSAHAVTRTGTPSIDVAAAVMEQLADRGVAATWIDGCTKESDRLYSYRRSHDTGRQAGVIVWREGTNS